MNKEQDFKYPPQQKPKEHGPFRAAINRGGRLNDAIFVVNETLNRGAIVEGDDLRWSSAPVVLGAKDHFVGELSGQTNPSINPRRPHIKEHRCAYE